MYPIEIKKEKYEANGAICLMAFSEGTEDMFGVITTNVPDELEEGEICVKTWSENAWVLQLLDKLPEHFKG